MAQPVTPVTYFFPRRSPPSRVGPGSPLDILVRCGFQIRVEHMRGQLRSPARVKEARPFFTVPALIITPAPRTRSFSSMVLTFLVLLLRIRDRCHLAVSTNVWTNFSMISSRSRRRRKFIIKVGVVLRSGDVTPCLLYTSPSPRD